MCMVYNAYHVNWKMQYSLPYGKGQFISKRYHNEHTCICIDYLDMLARRLFGVVACMKESYIIM